MNYAVYNDLMYKGKLKKKYEPKEVIEVIEDFSKQNQFEYEKDDKSISVKIMDDEMSQLTFVFEDNCLCEQLNQHETDENKKYEYIYKLLYLIKPYFSKYEVSDEFGIWAEYCYNKYPKKIIIRELSDEEKNLLDRIDTSDCQFQALQAMWAVIAMYLAEQTIYEQEGAGDVVNWDFIRRRIHPDCGSFVPIWIEGAVETWIRECMSYKNNDTVIGFGDDTSKLESKISALGWGFSDNIFDCDGGLVNTNQAIINKNYEYNKNKLKKCGIDIEKDKYFTYRFMLSALEYFGFHICVPYPTKIKNIKACNIDYWDTI